MPRAESSKVLKVKRYIILYLIEEFALMGSATLDVYLEAMNMRSLNSRKMRSVLSDQR